MSSFESIKNYSGEKAFSFIWEGPLNKTEIAFKVPDFSGNKFKVWGDWGPMYVINLSAENPIQMQYKDLNSEKVEEYALEQKTFKLNSPMLANIRELFPFFIEFSDERKGFIYQVYLDKKSEIAQIEIRREDDLAVLYKAEFESNR